MTIRSFKLFIPAFLVMYPFILYQKAEETINILSLKNKPYFKEECKFVYDTSLYLSHSMSFNQPGIIDEEYSYDLLLKILDTAYLFSKKKMDIENDSSLVKCKYGRFSAWDWTFKKTYKITGFIELSGKKRNEIDLELSLKILRENSKENVVYKGHVSFLKTNVLNSYLQNK